MSRRDEILKKVETIEKLPATAAKAVALLGNPDFGPAEVAKTLEHDPTMTANLLRVANSPFFGGVRTIESVRDAVVRLGGERVLQLMVAMALAPRVLGEIKGYGLGPGELLRHSVAVGMGAEALASGLKVRPPSHTFTSGLLVNIGKMVMGEFLALDSEPILQLAHEEMLSFEEAEMQVLGVTHSEVGACLLQHWNLPERMVNVVRYHLNPEEFEGEDLALDLVHMGDVVARMTGIGLGVDGMAVTPSVVVVQRLGLTEEIMEDALMSVAQESSGMSDVFASGS